MISRKKIVLAAAPIVVAIAIAVFLFLKPGRAEASTSGIGFEIADVESFSNREGIEISGNIEPANSADLAFPIGGYIEDILVSEGDLVEVGDVLAVLEDSQQRYDLAEVEVEIDTEIVTGTRRNLDLLNLKREMLQEELDNTRLASTVSGLVSEIDAEVGDYVRAQQAGSETDVVVRVIDRSSMKATVEVDELDAPYLRVGQEVEFIFDAYPDLVVPGIVSFVPYEAEETDEGIAVLQTEVSINDPPDEILPYFTFSGEIFLADDEDILLIPEDAVRTTDGRSMVLKAVSSEEAQALSAGTADRPEGPEGAEGEAVGGMSPAFPELPGGLIPVPVQVTVEEYGSGKVRVLSGLEAGDRVAVLRGTADGGAAPEADDAAGESEDEEGGTSVMDLLGFKRPGGGSGGPGGGPGGPPPGGN